MSGHGTTLLYALALVSAVLHIRAEYAGPRWVVYLCKPLTTGLILLAAALGPAPAASVYRAAILAGLAFSLAGDVFLMLPGDRFLPGLASFLAAHLCYIAAFSSGTRLGLSPRTTLPLVLYGALLLPFLWPRLGPMKVPVLLYMAVILAMAWRALCRWQQMGGTGALLAAAGALLFVASDSALALDRFRKPYPSAQFLIMSTYYAAQGLIALSV